MQIPHSLSRQYLAYIRDTHPFELTFEFTRSSSTCHLCRPIAARAALPPPRCDISPTPAATQPASPTCIYHLSYPTGHLRILHRLCILHNSATSLLHLRKDTHGRLRFARWILHLPTSFAYFQFIIRPTTAPDCISRELRRPATFRRHLQSICIESSISVLSPGVYAFCIAPNNIAPSSCFLTSAPTCPKCTDHTQSLT